MFSPSSLEPITNATIATARKIFGKYFIYSFPVFVLTASLLMVSICACQAESASLLLPNGGHFLLRAFAAQDLNDCGFWLCSQTAHFRPTKIFVASDATGCELEVGYRCPVHILFISRTGEGVDTPLEIN